MCNSSASADGARFSGSHDLPWKNIKQRNSLHELLSDAGEYSLQTNFSAFQTVCLVKPFYQVCPVCILFKLFQPILPWSDSWLTVSHPIMTLLLVVRVQVMVLTLAMLFVPMLAVVAVQLLLVVELVQTMVLTLEMLVLVAYIDGGGVAGGTAAGGGASAANSASARNAWC